MVPVCETCNSDDHVAQQCDRTRVGWLVGADSNPYKLLHDIPETGTCGDTIILWRHQRRKGVLQPIEVIHDGRSAEYLPVKRRDFWFAYHSPGDAVYESWGIAERRAEELSDRIKGLCGVAPSFCLGRVPTDTQGD